MGRYESVIVAQSENAYEFLDIIEVDGEEEALEYATQWHYPGEHETFDGLEYSSDTRVFERGDGYIITWVPNLEMFELIFDTEFDRAEWEEMGGVTGKLGW